VGVDSVVTLMDPAPRYCHNQTGNGLTPCESEPSHKSPLVWRVEHRADESYVDQLILVLLAEWTWAGRGLPLTVGSRGLLRQLRKDADLRQVDLARSLGKPQRSSNSTSLGPAALDVPELDDLRTRWPHLGRFRPAT
jgi:hypothetical protein